MVSVKYFKFVIGLCLENNLDNIKFNVITVLATVLPVVVLPLQQELRVKLRGKASLK